MVAETAKNAKTGKTRTRRSWPERFWGHMVAFDMRIRVAALILVIAAIASMSFTQLGFWSIGIIDAKPVYLMLLLGPLAMGALMFGPLIGGLLGLLTGAIVFSHAVFFYLDYYELYFMTTLNTFVLLAAVGVCSGLLFNIVLKHLKRGVARAAGIIGACIAISFAVSGLVQLNTLFSYGGLENLDAIVEYLLNSPAGVAIQALIDATLMAFLCVVTDAILCGIADRGNDRRLLSMFRSWMLLVSFIVFVTSSAIFFVVTTQYTLDSAVQNMHGEVDYLANQLDKWGDDDADSLLDGYDVSTDGRVAIVDKNGVILTSDDETLPAGESIMRLLGYGDLDEAMKIEYFLGFNPDGSASDSAMSLQAMNEAGETTMDIDLMVADAYDDGYVIIIKPSSMIFEARAGIMAAITLLAIILIAAMAILASRLLKNVVVQRIDETNSSWSKITEGDLNERVRVRDSREFASLSAGINSTVAALKGTIAEVEQKNAQELATAKAIQESSLPRDFPPFPDIDRFDIYASMKTAKEVGGDFYNFFLIDDERLGFLIADVSGKGIPAALFMMTAKTQIQTYMEEGLPVGEAVNAANHQLCIGNEAGMFVTAFVCVLEYQTGKLTYVNAGHNPPLLHHEGSWEWMRNVSGMPLGLFDGIPYDQYELQLEKDNVIYLYTDGVTEAMDTEGNLFGENRLEELLSTYADMNPLSLCVGVSRALTDYTMGAEQSDDITMVCLKYGVPPEHRAQMVLPAVDTQIIHVHNFMHEELRRHNAPKSVYNMLDIAAEELFVNVCHYAYPDATPDNPGEARISFEYESNPPSLAVTIADDGIPYDPTAKPDAMRVDEYENVEDAPIGGLGIFMAKQCVDSMEYKRVDGSNILTFRKGW